MSQLYAVQLKFTGSVHFGSSRLDYGKSERFLHSDTLYAAIFQAWAMLGKKEWIEQYKDDRDFVLSSSFPFYRPKEGDPVYFLPKPYAPLFPDQANADGKIDRKLVKKVSWIDLRLFAQWCRDGNTPLEAKYIHKEFYTSQDWLKDEKGNELSLCTSEVYPRVKVSRVDGEDAVPYYIEKLYFNNSSGLYLIFHGNEESLCALKHALEVLKDEGLGTDRKVGHGQFKYTIDPFFDLEKQNGEFAVNLSLFVPESKEWLDSYLPDRNLGGYELIQRGGWITTPPFNTLQKNRLSFFKEGSIFKFANQIAGVTHDLCPEIISGNPDAHPVYRVGKALFVRFNK
ncbi:type III-A CRISPR-associated RAMP protein Csm4 [Pleomorphovibrio marinus]|uniref:type III-A CRISPR-associated RAMP protein Csm4 n=1 Tax=Pleomorphovibrio marinus TaxID=2164132 RepID=UPI000E0C1BAE|nr:type III-A CRISPR-associated RAMP protein Csm4 [Pleomorphovibrio marinus]